MRLGSAYNSSDEERKKKEFEDSDSSSEESDWSNTTYEFNSGSE